MSARERALEAAERALRALHPHDSARADDDAAVAVDAIWPVLDEENERLRAEIEEWKIRHIVASNPGIDEAEVRRSRAEADA